MEKHKSSTLTLEEYCKLAARTEKPIPSWVPPDRVREYRLAHAVLGLHSEAYEFNEAIVNNSRIDTMAELGDYWWYTALAWNALELEPRIPPSPAYGIDMALSVLSEVSKVSFIYEKELLVPKAAACIGSIAAGLVRLATIHVSLASRGEAFDNYSITQDIWKMNIAKLATRYGDKFDDVKVLEEFRDRRAELLAMEQQLNG